MEESTPIGFYVPVHRSLTEPVLMGGVPRTVAILNGTFTAALVMGLSSFWVLPFSLTFHLFMVSACKVDPDIAGVVLENIKQPSHLEV